jgi:hypothetical protein
MPDRVADECVDLSSCFRVDDQLVPIEGCSSSRMLEQVALVLKKSATCFLLAKPFWFSDAYVGYAQRFFWHSKKARQSNRLCLLDEVSLPHGPRNVPLSVKVVRSRVRSPELRIVCRVHVKRLSSAVCRVALATRMAVY